MTQKLAALGFTPENNYFIKKDGDFTRTVIITGPNVCIRRISQGTHLLHVQRMTYEQLESDDVLAALQNYMPPKPEPIFAPHPAAPWPNPYQNTTDAGPSLVFGDRNYQGLPLVFGDRTYQGPSLVFGDKTYQGPLVFGNKKEEE